MSIPHRIMALCALCLSLGACGGGLADIRPDALKVDGAPTSQQSERGRAIIERMARAHGIDTWKTFNFMTATSEDEWFNAFFYAVAAPYTENPERARVASYIHQFPHARVEFLAGENASEVWTVKGRALKRRKASEDVESFEQKDDALFAAFAHNFLLWPNVPFHMATADQWAYLDTKSWEGRTFERVLLSWKTLKPQADIDQWIVWVNTSTHLMERVEFTIRLSGEGQLGVYNLRGFKDVQGMKVAHVYEGLLELEDEPLHTYTYSDIEFSQRQVVDLTKLAP